MNWPEIEPYRALAEAGPEAVAEEAKRRGLSPIEIIKVLHEVCGLNIGVAKELLHQVWPEMHAFHNQLMADVDAVQKELDEEHGSS